jgi:SAM-dependent methyltransferase
MFWTQFDIVFTSYGVLHWLQDLWGWGQIIAHYLKPGGIFYIVEDHPFFRVLRAGADTGLRAERPYFFSETPEQLETTGSYATNNQGEAATYYIWNHSLGEVLNALIEAGLTIEFLHEFPYAARAKFAFMEQGPDGWWRLPAGHEPIPFLFSLQARKPM